MLVFVVRQSCPSIPWIPAAMSADSNGWGTKSPLVPLGLPNGVASQLEAGPVCYDGACVKGATEHIMSKIGRLVCRLRPPPSWTI